MVNKDYEVSFYDFQIGTLWNGDYYIQIRLKFTNDYVYRKSFHDIAIITAYQNNELMEYYPIEDSGMYDNVFSESSIIVSDGYRIDNFEDDIQIIITEYDNSWFSSSKRENMGAWTITGTELQNAILHPTPFPTNTLQITLPPTIDLTSYAQTQMTLPTYTPTPIPEPFKTIELGDYIINIMTVQRNKKLDGRLLLEFSMIFYNNSNKITSFEQTFTYHVYFNGVELTPTSSLLDSTNKNMYTNIKPGAKIHLIKTFELQEISKGNIELDIKPYGDNNHQFNEILGSFN